MSLYKPRASYKLKHVLRHVCWVELAPMLLQDGVDLAWTLEFGSLMFGWRTPAGAADCRRVAQRMSK